MAAEETKVSSELTELQLKLQQNILSQGIELRRFIDKDCSKTKIVSEKNRALIPHLDLCLNEKVLHFTGAASDNLVNDIFNYLDSMGTTFLSIPKWQWVKNDTWYAEENDDFIRCKAEPGLEFLEALFRKLAELKKLKTFETRLGNRYLMLPLHCFLLKSGITALRIYITFSSNRWGLFEVEHELYSTIIKSSITELRIAGIMHYPKIFAQAIRDSWITSLDFSLRTHNKDTEQEYFAYTYLNDEDLKFLAKKLNASAVKTLYLPETYVRIRTLKNLVSPLAEHIYVPLYRPLCINISDNDERMTALMQQNFLKVRMALEEALPADFIAPLQNNVAEYLYLPSQPLREVPTDKAEENKPKLAINNTSDRSV